MGLEQRIKRLEGAGRGGSCPACGQPSTSAYDATHVDSYETYQEVYESGPEFCEACGRRVLHPVYFDTDKAATTLPVMIVRVRPKPEEEYAGGD
jgi:hypothetical protein